MNFEEIKKYFLETFKNVIIKENSKEYILRAFYAEKIKPDRYGKLYVSKKNLKFYNFRPVEHYYPILTPVERMKQGNIRKLFLIFAKFYNKPEVLYEFDALTNRIIKNEKISDYTINIIEEEAEEVYEQYFSEHFPILKKMPYNDMNILKTIIKTVYKPVYFEKNNNKQKGMAAKIFALNGEKIKYNGLQLRLLENKNLRYLTLSKEEKGNFHIRKGTNFSKSMLITEGIKDSISASFLFNNIFTVYFCPLTNRFSVETVEKIAKLWKIDEIFIIPDNDTAGQELIKKAKELKKSFKIYKINYDTKQKDFTDFLNYSENYYLEIQML